jgi:tetratricopeptide (TPR) repeat protein
MAFSPDTWLKEGIAAARTGQSERARENLLRAIKADEGNVQAWYWLSRIVESPQEREICLENVLALDPGHAAIQAELAELHRQIAEARAAAPVAALAPGAAIPRTVEEQLFSDAAVEPLHCPFCGGFTAPDDRQCPGCAGELYARQPKSKDHSIYSLGLVVVWVALASYIWVGLTAYYLLSGLWSAVDASPGAGSTVQTLGGLLGLKVVGAPLLELPLAPVLLVGGAAFLFSLVVAWGLYRRLRTFYWLTLALVLLYPLAIVYRVATAETVPVMGLVIEGLLTLLALGFAFMAHDEFAWVERRLDASVDKDVGSDSALYARGRVYAQRRMWAKAAAHWSKAAALSPGHPDYRLALASAYINLDQPKRALEHLHKAEEIEPDNPQVQELLGSLSR